MGGHGALGISSIRPGVGAAAGKMREADATLDSHARWLRSLRAQITEASASIGKHRGRSRARPGVAADLDVGPTALQLPGQVGAGHPVRVRLGDDQEVLIHIQRPR